MFSAGVTGRSRLQRPREHRSTRVGRGPGEPPDASPQSPETERRAHAGLRAPGVADGAGELGDRQAAQRLPHACVCDVYASTGKATSNLARVRKTAEMAPGICEKNQKNGARGSEKKSHFLTWNWQKRKLELTGSPPRQGETWGQMLRAWCPVTAAPERGWGPGEAAETAGPFSNAGGRQGIPRGRRITNTAG